MNAAMPAVKWVAAAAMAATALAGAFAAPMPVMGAPAWFEVEGAEVRVTRAGDAAEVRIVYDLSVREAACGWFQAEFEDLAAKAEKPMVTLLLDGKEAPSRLVERDGSLYVQAFQDEKDAGRPALEKAKSVQVVLAFPKTACAGADVAVALPFPRSQRFWEEKEKPRMLFPRLAVRYDADVEEATTEIRTTFKAVARGTRLVLRSDARSAGASLLREAAVVSK